MDYDLGQGMDYGWCVGQNQDQDGDQDMEDIDENWDAVKNMNWSWNRMWVCLGYGSGQASRYGEGWELG